MSVRRSTDCRPPADGLLGAHVGRGADDPVPAGELGIVLLEERQPEVDDPGLARPGRSSTRRGASARADGSSMMLAGLTSRWIAPIEWA